MAEYQNADLYESYAKALVQKMPELRHVPIGSIVFVENVGKRAEGKPKRRLRLSSLVKPKKKLVKFAMTRKLSPLLAWITGKAYIIEISQDACQNWSREKMQLLVYHQLKHIALDGKLVQHDVEEWGQVAQAIGADWSTTHRTLPDILAPGFDWSKYRAPQITMSEVLQGQEAEAASAVVSGGGS